MSPIFFLSKPRFRRIWIALFALILWPGCASPTKGPVVFYCEGAGWFASAGPVESGLHKAGYTGQFHNYTWTSFLGPAHDHFVNAGSKAIARGLTHRIEKLRESDPSATIGVMGLSAGTAVVVHALEQLPAGVQVDYVVLFSPSISAEHNLTKAMQHVKRNLYATYSSHDGILSNLSVNADGMHGLPAGLRGIRAPSNPTAAAREAYDRVVNLPWTPAYVGYGWTGSHTSVTNSEFVAHVIAPRVLSGEPYPLDRPLMAMRDGK